VRFGPPKGLTPGPKFKKWVVQWGAMEPRGKSPRAQTQKQNCVVVANKMVSYVEIILKRFFVFGFV